MQQPIQSHKRLIFVAILLVIALPIYIYIALHRIPSTPRNDNVDTQSLIDCFTFDTESSGLTIRIEPSLLNDYITRTPSSLTSADDRTLTFTDVHFFEDEPRIGFTLTKETESPIYIEGIYTSSLSHHSLFIELDKDTIGSLPSFLSGLFQNDYEHLRLELDLSSMLMPLDGIYMDHLSDHVSLTFEESALVQTTSMTGYVPTTSSTWRPLTDTHIDINELYAYDPRDTTPEDTAPSLARTMSISQLSYMFETLYASGLVDNYEQSGWEFEPVTTSDERVYHVLAKDPRTNFQTVIRILFDEHGQVSTVSYPSLGKNEEDISLNEKTGTYLSATMNDHLEPFYNSRTQSLHIIATTTLPFTGDIQLTVKPETWTILVYMIGSDLESGYNFYTNTISGNASKDLKEMMAASYNPNVQIIVQTGGTTHWDIESINPLINQRFQVKNGELIHLEDLKLLNMVQPKTLSDFALWGIDTYPSDHTALILWDHGGGSLYGFGVDEYYPNDSFTLDELDIAMQTITDTYGKPLEVIGFDACLMATLETAHILSPYGNYLIASEDTEPESGWEYTRLLHLLDTYPVNSGDTFGSFVIQSFYNSFNDEAINHQVLTLSVIDLSLIGPIIEAMDRILPQVDYSSMTQLIPKMKAIGGTSIDNGYTDHYDLYELSRLLPDSMAKEAADLEDALNQAVVYHAEGVLAMQAKGLSFYLPYYDIRYPYHIKSYYTPVTFSDNYLDYLSGFLDYRALVTADTTDIPFTIQEINRPFTLTIPENYMDQVSDVYLSISLIDKRLAYERTVDLGYDALAYPLSQKGMYEENFSVWPSIGQQPIPVYLTHNGTESISYETPVLLNGEEATLMLAYIYATDTYEIIGIRKPSSESSKDDPTSSIIDRTTVLLNPGDQVDILYNIYDPEDKRWYDETLYSFIMDDEGNLPVIDNYQIQKEDYKNYRMQFVIKDTNGNLYYSQLLHPLG